MKKSKFYKISALTLTLSLVVGSTVFADTLSNAGGYKNRTQSAKGNFNIKAKWDRLVTAGTITQEEETAAIALFNTASGETPKKYVNPIKTKLDTLVTAGTITQDEETAVLNISTPVKGKIDSKSKMRTGLAKGRVKQKVGIKAGLDGLVTAGTLTTSQETSIITILTPVNPIKTKLDTLVTAGTITQDEETAVLNISTPAKGKIDSKSKMRTGLAMGKIEHKVGIKAGLDGLVTAGTLTAEQETLIITALTPVNPIKTKLDTLVTAGTITSDQETTMINALIPTKGVQTRNKRY